MRKTFIQRLLRKSPPDLWDLGAGAGEVMLARISRAMTGRLTAAEARRMVVEKQVAGVRAQFVLARAFLDGKHDLGRRAVFDIYHAAVQSNRKRLRKRSRWWR